MDRIEVGDTVVSKGKATPDRYEVLAVHAHQLWLKPEGGASALSYLVCDFEKVEPFFEAGKTYERAGAISMRTNRYVCERADTDYKGRKVAYGRYYNESGLSPFVWLILSNFKGWEQV